MYSRLLLLLLLLLLLWSLTRLCVIFLKNLVFICHHLFCLLNLRVTISKFHQSKYFVIVDIGNIM
jgi:hypothetical protein